MKIEKISDTQIRCTLNKEDLLDRQLRLSELAYGSDKAKMLFQDMMQQASCEFGFEADDIPLMIEAIPVSPECLVLVVTKMEEPEELDTRFSNFTQYSGKTAPEEDIVEEQPYADEILNCYEHIEEMLGGSKDASDSKSENESGTTESNETVVRSAFTRVYSFRSIQEIQSLVKILGSYYKGQNTLYKNPMDGFYYLAVSMSGHTPEEFNKICNIISEYAKTERTTYASLAYFNEHYLVVIKDSAMQQLAKL